MDERTKQVFISYSWTVQKRVIELADRLIDNGIEVIIDVYDLKEGQDKFVFMEQAVHNKDIDRVLIISDRAYTDKANNRTGGVGDETVIITQEIYHKTKQEKFIPIVFERDENNNPYLPIYLKSRIYIDLSTEDELYESEYEKLVRNIYEKPLYRKKALGPKPEWVENETVNFSNLRSLIKKFDINREINPSRAQFFLKKFNTEFVIAAKQFNLPKDKPKEETIIDVINETKVLRDLFVDFCENIISQGLYIGDCFSAFIEYLYNALHDTSNLQSYSESDFELYDFMIWELFISATAIMLYYEKYSDIYSMLNRSYFLKGPYLSNRIEAYNYFRFRKHLSILEEKCKMIDYKRITMAGHILVHRERKPILTKQSISNADIVLYQLGSILMPPEGLPSSWFPTTYIFHENEQLIWKKLCSRSYCFKIAPLFGVKTVEEIKELIIMSKRNRRIGYNRAFDNAPEIYHSIDTEHIGTMN